MIFAEVLGFLVAVLGIAACSPGPALPAGESGVTSSHYTGREYPPRLGGDVTGNHPVPFQGSSAASSPTAARATGPNGGEGVLLLLEGGQLPADASCSGWAQSLGNVRSGGGELSGGTVQLGEISIAAESRLSLIPGKYVIHVRCVLGYEMWEGVGSTLLIARGEYTDHTIGMNLKP